ncbi:glucosaminidase domain-containing protein [Agaribacter flavus]|uniref:Glucosaminidase domain-containing protein n=1 Tax=Agaribacter flavus TaxID=1902781 RepID=A0ABV7FSQ2_9ALTE
MKSRTFHKAKVILLATLFVVIVVLAIILSQPQQHLVSDIPELEDDTSPVPNFAKYENIEEKKRAFFEYLRPAVQAQNDYIMTVRQYVQGLRAKELMGEAFTSSQQEQLDWLLKEYRVDEGLSREIMYRRLLKKIDIIPLELVLVQSANESAWGTSRFARKGYNFFGLWCFVENCGFVPSRRNPGAVHEVAKFDDLSSAMYNYMRNINRHPAYAELRNIRQRLRENQQAISASKLAEGLTRYSERGEEYVDELKQMIRVNKELISV